MLTSSRTLPDVSIIIPVYNRASLLKRAIESAIGDGGDAVEVIVVDDGSTDNSTEVAQSFGSPVKVFRQRNAGPSAARNLGLAHAQGRYVRFLDSDDWLLPGANAKQGETLDITGANVCYGDWRDAYSHQSPNVEGERILSMGPVNDPVEALLSDKWCPPFCYLLRRNAVNKIGGWDEDLKLFGTEDLDFILRIALNGNSFVHIPCDVGRYFQHSGARVSRESLVGWCDAAKRIYIKAISFLNERSEWTTARRNAVAGSLLRLAKVYYGIDKSKFLDCIRILTEVAPEFKPPCMLYRCLVDTLGYERAESILEIRRKFRRRITRSNKFGAFK